MRKGIKKALVLVAGWTFIVLGIAGLFLPILQGILFLMIGLTILSSEYLWAHHVLKKLEKRFPETFQKTTSTLHRMKSWLRSRLRRHTSK